MKKLLFLLVLGAASLTAMEERQSSCGDSKADDQQQLLSIFLPKASRAFSSWSLLPAELKLRILSFVSKVGYCQDIKALLLVNHEFNDFATSATFLQAFAYGIVKNDPKKALDIYAWAMEHQNIVLAQCIFNAYLTHCLASEEIIDRNDIGIVVILAMVKQNFKAARRVFCAAVEQDNKALIRLIIAAKSEMLKCLGNLTDHFFGLKGLNYNSFSKNGGMCPLKRAAAYGHRKIVKLLVKADADIDLPDTYKTHRDKYEEDASTIRAAILRNDVDMVRLLHTLRLQTEPYSEQAENCLIRAIHEDKIEIVKILLKGWPVNRCFEGRLYIHDTTGEKFTALTLAASYGHNDLVLFLLSMGADVNQYAFIKVKKTYFGKEELSMSPDSAADLAERWGYIDTADLLKSAKKK